MANDSVDEAEAADGDRAALATRGLSVGVDTVPAEVWVVDALLRLWRFGGFGGGTGRASPATGAMTPPVTAAGAAVVAVLAPALALVEMASSAPLVDVDVPPWRLRSTDAARATGLTDALRPAPSSWSESDSSSEVSGSGCSCRSVSASTPSVARMVLGSKSNMRYCCDTRAGLRCSAGFERYS